MGYIFGKTIEDHTICDDDCLGLKNNRIAVYCIFCLVDTGLSSCVIMFLIFEDKKRTTHIYFSVYLTVDITRDIF